MAGDDAMSFESDEKDQFGHRKLGGIGDRVAETLKKLSPQFNQGRRVNVVSQRLGYLVRCGEPDALDSIVPMAFGNLALDLIDAGRSGQLVAVQNGRYGSVPISAIMGAKKAVDIGKYYDTERLRPKFKSFSELPLFIMTSEAQSDRVP